MSTHPARRKATYADVLAAPRGLVAELVAGVLHTQPRPSPRHGVAASSLGAELLGEFQKGRDGPGDWIFVAEPECHFGEDILVPDIAAWRRERLPRLPDKPYFETVPDWVCEILSPSTQRRDRGVKREIYARAGVPYLWLLDPEAQVLEAYQLAGDHWLLAGTATSSGQVRLPPFEAASFPLSLLFPFDEPLPDDPEG